MTELHLLIDDIRDNSTPGINVDLVAKTGIEGLAVLADNAVTHLWLDHDLGDTTAMTGYDVICELERRNSIPDVVGIVSSNPVGRHNIEGVLKANNYIYSIKHNAWIIGSES